MFQTSTNPIPRDLPALFPDIEAATAAAIASIIVRWMSPMLSQPSRDD